MHRGKNYSKHASLIQNLSLVLICNTGLKMYICIFILPEAGSHKQAMEKKQAKNKYILKEINTM